MQSPVLLIVFNRPEYTKIVFNAIRDYKPNKLYIFADGPRTNNENDKINCKATRELLKNIDWVCNVKYNLLSENLGCGVGVSTAISWAFENEEKLIILEDDCVPTNAFFNYCNYCLDKYEKDQRIWIVSGRSHHENSKYFYNYDYLFSNYCHTWGWATWKRCWQYYDLEMCKWPEFIKMGGFLNTFLTKKEGKYFNQIYSKYYQDKKLKYSTWDYQHVFGMHLHGGLSIIPSKNLIENIGISGTHYSKKDIKINSKANENFIIKNIPQVVLSNREYDLMHYKKHIIKNNSLIKKIINKIYPH